MNRLLSSNSGLLRLAMHDQAFVRREWLTRHTVEVAWDLIGCVVRLDRDGATVSGRIVETEAYAGPGDPASHASRLKVAREVMAMPPGTIYTYLSYGIHRMLNFVAHDEGESGGILIRAIEPLDGREVMRTRRGGVPDQKLASGPGSLGQAFAISLDDLGTDLLDSPSWTLEHGEPRDQVLASPRIGISRAVEVPWRFFERSNRHVSRHRRGVAVGRDDIASLTLTAT